MQLFHIFFSAEFGNGFGAQNAEGGVVKIPSAESAIEPNFFNLISLIVYPLFLCVFNGEIIAVECYSILEIHLLLSCNPQNLFSRLGCSLQMLLDICILSFRLKL